MRDFLAATRDRVVVFDGGMGATLEQFDLSLEDDYKLPGRCHEALILNRPDVIEGVHASMIEAGAEVVETDTFQASRLKLEEWGLAEYTREINVKAAQIARKAVGEHNFVAGSMVRPGSCPRRRSAEPRADPLPRARRDLQGAVRGAARRRRGPADRGDGAGHPRGQGRDLRHARGVQDRRPQRADPGVRLAAAQRRQDAAGHGHLRRAGDARGPEGRRHRPQLLHRPRGHARRDPLPRRVLAGADPLHPERRHPAQGPDGETIFPEQPGPLAEALGDFVERYGVGIVGGCCGTTPAHIAAIKERCGSHSISARPAPRPPHVSSMIAAAPLVQEPPRRSSASA